MRLCTFPPLPLPGFPLPTDQPIGWIVSVVPAVFYWIGYARDISPLPPSALKTKATRLAVLACGLAMVGLCGLMLVVPQWQEALNVWYTRLHPTLSSYCDTVAYASYSHAKLVGDGVRVIAALVLTAGAGVMLYLESLLPHR